MGVFSRRQNDDIFLMFTENRLWYFMQIVSLGESLHDLSVYFLEKYLDDNLHEMPKLIFWEKWKRQFAWNIKAFFREK